MVLGGGASIDSSTAGFVVFGVLKVLGFVMGLYIAKHLNLGYDSIF